MTCLLLSFACAHCGDVFQVMVTGEVLFKTRGDMKAIMEEVYPLIMVFTPHGMPVVMCEACRVVFTCPKNVEQHILDKLEEDIRKSS